MSSTVTALRQPLDGLRIDPLAAPLGAEIHGLDGRRGPTPAQILALKQALRFAYTHRWEVGDIVYWDNQATLHARNGFPANQRRRLKRISLAGSRPF